MSWPHVAVLSLVQGLTEGRSDVLTERLTDVLTVAASGHLATTHRTLKDEIRTGARNLRRFVVAIPSVFASGLFSFPGERAVPAT